MVRIGAAGGSEVLRVGRGTTGRADLGPGGGGGRAGDAPCTSRQCTRAHDAAAPPRLAARQRNSPAGAAAGRLSTGVDARAPPRMRVAPVDGGASLPAVAATQQQMSTGGAAWSRESGSGGLTEAGPHVGHSPGASAGAPAVTFSVCGGHCGDLCRCAGVAGATSWVVQPASGELRLLPPHARTPPSPAGDASVVYIDTRTLRVWREASAGRRGQGARGNSRAPKAKTRNGRG